MDMVSCYSGMDFVVVVNRRSAERTRSVSAYFVMVFTEKGEGRTRAGRSPIKTSSLTEFE